MRLKLVAAIASLFLSSMILAGLCKPEVFYGFLSRQSLLFDAVHYFEIARDGYFNPAIAAFYPLWPLIIRYFILPFSEHNAVIASCFLAFSVYILSLFPWLKASFVDKAPASLQLCILAIYSLNPNSLFHIMPYAESLTALAASFYLFYASRWFSLHELQAISEPRLRHRKTSAALGFSVSLFILGLTRPVALPLSASLLAALPCIFYFREKKRGENSTLDLSHRVIRFLLDPVVLFCVISLCTSWFAYLPLGLHTQNVLNDFWAPFHAQKYWGRTFNFHWDILLHPKSVSGSDNVLLWDIQAFYIPFILLFIPFIGHFSKKIKLAALAPLTHLGHDTLYWVCAFFAAMHAAIAFLTYPIFMSLARHVFALPFMFYCLAAIFRLFWEHKPVRRIAWSYAVLGFAFLIYWWTRYAREGWLG